MRHSILAAQLILSVLATALPVRGQQAATSSGTAPMPPKPADKRPVRAETLPTKVDYVPQGRYDELRDFVTRAHAEGGTLFNSPDGEMNYMLARRTAASDVEEHSRWDDVIVVRSGAGNIQVGRRTKGARFLSAGELRGGTIVSPSVIQLRPGDIARIPAGTPHAFTPLGSEPWEFLIIKVRRANKPLKRPPETTAR